MNRIVGWAIDESMKARRQRRHGIFALFQKNVLDRRRWVTRDELRIEVVTWIERSTSAADAKPASAD